MDEIFGHLACQCHSIDRDAEKDESVTIVESEPVMCQAASAHVANGSVCDIEALASVESIKVDTVDAPACNPDAVDGHRQLWADVCDSDTPLLAVNAKNGSCDSVGAVAEGGSLLPGSLEADEGKDLVELWDCIYDEIIDAEKDGRRCQDALATAAGGLDAMDHSTMTSELCSNAYEATRDLSRWLDDCSGGPKYRKDIETKLGRARECCRAGKLHLVELARPCGPPKSTRRRKRR